MIPVPETILTELCRQAGVPRDALVFLGGGRGDSDGIAYEYQAEGAGPRVLKIMAIPAGEPDRLFEFHERMQFVHFLGQHGVNIVYPIPQSGGELCITCPHEDNLFLAYRMEKAEGVHARGELLDPEFARRYGALVGKLHQVTQQYPTWRHSTCAGRDLLGWEKEWQTFYDMARDPRIRSAWQALREKLDRLPVERGCFGFVHNDPHSENLLVCRDRLVLLDFDVANYHWFASDITITLQAILFRFSGGLDRPLQDIDPLIKFLAAFVQGYRTHNDLPDFWLEQIDTFISYRRLLLYTVMQDWLEKKPKIRGPFRKMILENPPIFNR